MVTRRRLALCALAAVLSAAIALPAAAETAVAEPEGWSYALWRELMSPFCPGRSLADCPSSDAETLRMWILMQEAAGREKEDVERELVERYGNAVLAAPQARGLGLAAYVIPALAFVVGGALVWVFLRRQTRHRAAPQPTAPTARPLDPELERLIDAEVER